MADSDFKVKAIIEANTSNFDKGMKQAQASANSLSNTFGNLSKVITKALSFAGLAVGTKAIVDFGKSCVQSANQANKTFRILDTTIKATGADAWTSTKELEGLAKNLSDETNYSVTEIEKMQSVLLGFRDITSETFEDASDAVLDMATVMGMDLTSAVQTVGKALDDPIKGLDSLRRQGFQFTDQQKAELTQLVKTGKKIEAQKIILDELSRSYGGASKAGQDSFAQQRHAVENFQDTLGTKLIPTIKLFAQENAKTINSLRDGLENIDFNQIGAVVVTSFNTLKNSVKNLSEPFKAVGENLKEFITNIDLKPFVSVLETLIGAFKKINEIKIDSGVKSIQNLKNIISGIGESVDINRIAEVINLVINGFVFLYNEVSKVFDTLQENIKTFVLNVWNSIKSIFEAGNKALADSEGDIKSWKDFVYNIFNSAFKVIQDLVNSVSVILKGDWKTAWNYMKLAVLRTLKSISDSITAFVNAFPKPFQKIIDTINDIIDAINTAKKFFRIPGEELRKIDDLKPVNFSEKLGIDTAIAETEKAIENATGDYKNKNLKDLEDFASGSKGALGKFVDNFKEATDQAKKELDALGQYTPPALSNPEQAEENASETYQIYSEWDSKLLEQRLENLNDWEKEYHEINLALIEEERKKALEADKTGAETEKINEYYNKKIVQENERAEEAKRNHVKETVSKITGYMKSLASNTIAIFKKVVSTIKNIFSTIGNFIENTFSGIKNIFSKLFDFNIDDALDSLLEIEDAILTFFVETLPNLPSFFESAFSSVLILIQTLINSIDWSKVSEFLNSIINTFITHAPEIISGIVGIFTNLVTTITDTLGSKSGEIVEAFGNMFFSIVEALPEILSKIISALGSFVSAIGKYFADNAQKLSDDLVNIVNSIVSGISNFIKTGGWKNLLQGLLSIQKAIENAIADNMEDIVNTISDMLPDLIQTLIDSIVSASKTLGKIAKSLLPLIADLINAIVDVITSDEVLDSSFDAIEGIVTGLVQAIIKILTKAFPKLVQFAIKLATNPATIAKLVASIISGLVNGFAKTDWMQVIKDIFMSFIDAFKDLFGIHSPSTLFEEFGMYIMEGFWEGMKNFASWLWDNVKNLFSNIWEGIKDVFSNIGDWFSNTFSGAWDGIKNAFQNVKEWASGVWGNIKDGFSGIGDWFKSTFENAVKNIKKAFDGIGDWFKNLWKGIQDGWNNLKTTISQGAQTVGQTVAHAVDGGVTGSSAGDIGLAIATGGISAIGHGLGWWAKGTNAVPRGLSIVGEAGPELVNFRGGEQILNNHNTQKALSGMSGKNITNNITFNNLNDTTAYAMMQQMRAYNRQLAINGVL